MGSSRSPLTIATRDDAQHFRPSATVTASIGNPSLRSISTPTADAPTVSRSRPENDVSALQLTSFYLLNFSFPFLADG